MSKLFGLILAATGIAHFVKPELFKEITAPAFPDNTDQAIQINGGVETALGLALLAGKKRFAGLGLLAYGGWLGYNAANAGK